MSVSKSKPAIFRFFTSIFRCAVAFDVLTWRLIEHGFATFRLNLQAQQKMPSRCVCVSSIWMGRAYVGACVFHAWTCSGLYQGGSTPLSPEYGRLCLSRPHSLHFSEDRKGWNWPLEATSSLHQRASRGSMPLQQTCNHSTEVAHLQYVLWVARHYIRVPSISPCSLRRGVVGCSGR